MDAFSFIHNKMYGVKC